MNAKETAVVLIEFQNEFCKEGGKFYEAVKDEITRQGTVANAARLAAEARKKGCLIIHSPFVYDEQWVDGKGCGGILAGAKEMGACRPGDPGTELIDELQPQAGDVVLSGKRALSGFTNTELDKALADGSIKNVVCAGFLTNVCVEATARSAYDRGFQVVIAKDATGATSQANQQYVENEIAPVLGQAMTVDELLAALE